MVKISVTIPVFNAEKTIQQCIKSVLDNDYENFEVILVDDHSTDKTRDILEGIGDTRARALMNKVNSGASISRNYGIKESRGDIILLLDSDSYVNKDWIAGHVRVHQEISADIVGGGMVGIYKTIFGKCDNFCSWFTSIPFSKSYYLTRSHLPTNNMSIKRNVFKEVGYFNGSLKTGEDAEFCFRALRKKYKIYYKSDLVAYHYDRNNFRDFLTHQENWGKHAIQMRQNNNMDFSYLLPKSYIVAYLYIFPLSLLYTGYIISKWVRYAPSVLWCAPIIFLGKLQQALAIKNSFKGTFVN
ncbi:MAG: glycosyltransferase [Candidatus Omnitrophota bacterium]|nr:glycosyltransferase [Candidatus Omnitrophota bacterium]